MVGFDNPYTILGVEPGLAIEFADLPEVVAFEDDIVQAIYPRLTTRQREAWASRPPLRDRLYPSKFNGRLLDITLTVMNEPYNSLLKARATGVRFPGHMGGFKRDSGVSITTRERYVGFSFAATAKTTGRPPVGKVRADMWYAPGLPGASGYGVQQASANGTVLRIISQPRIENDTIEQAVEEAKKIGFQVLRQQMAHPISTPMRD